MVVLAALVIPTCQKLVGREELGERGASTVASADEWERDSDGGIIMDPCFNDWITGAVAVKAVVFDCAEGESKLGFSSNRRLVEKGVEHPAIVSKSSKFLTTSEVVELAELVTGSHAPPPLAGCYVPHHGFIFYGEDDAILGYIEICLMCQKGGGVPRQGLADDFDYEGLAQFIDSIGLPVFKEFVEWEAYFAENDS